MMITTNKFRSRDQKILFNTLQKVIQIRAKIEEKAIEEQTGPEDLPKSLLPTDVLYDITSAFEAMYNKLLAKNLVDAGYPKSDLNITH